MSRTLFSAAVALLTLAVASANADILYEADFEDPPFTIGNLSGQDGWTDHSGTGTPVQVISGQAVELMMGTGSREDVNVGLGQTMGAGDIWQFAFDVTVSGSGEADTTYFAHFRDDGTGFNARVFVTGPNTGGNDFTFGIGESSSVADQFLEDFVYGREYRVTAAYNFDTGISSLSIDGNAPIFSSSAPDPGENIQTFAFRQAGGNTSMVIDNLVVQQIPEPGSMAVFGAAIAGLALIRRRK